MHLPLYRLQGSSPKGTRHQLDPSPPTSEAEGSPPQDQASKRQGRIVLCCAAFGPYSATWSRWGSVGLQGTGGGLKNQDRLSTMILALDEDENGEESPMA